MRAAVFGTYDIIVSTAGLVLGVAAGGAGAKCNLIADVASLVAGR